MEGEIQESFPKVYHLYTKRNYILALSCLACRDRFLGGIVGESDGVRAQYSLLKINIATTFKKKIR